MKKLLVCLLCLLISACGPTSIITKPIDKPALNLPDPDALDLKDVKFIVIHKDNAQKVFQDLAAKGIEPVVFALTGDDYKALALNINDIKTYIKLQKKIIILYRDYYEGKKPSQIIQKKERSRSFFRGSFKSHIGR